MELRRLSEEDLEWTFEARNHPDVMKWCRQYAPLHWANHCHWLEAQAERDDVDMFAMEDGDIPIGVCGLTDIDWVNRRAEFSLYVRPGNQGQGYGKQGLQMLLNYGFDVLNLNRIWGETFEDNPALKLFESLGFEEEGIRKEFYYRDGKYIDCHLVSISREQFI